MTKNELRAQLSLLVDLMNATTKLKKTIVKDLGGEDTEDMLQEILSEVQEGSNMDVENIVDSLIGDELEEGVPCDTPYLMLTTAYNIEVGVKYVSGEKLAGYLGESDCGTYQTGSMYYSKDGSPVDLSRYVIQKMVLLSI